MTDRLTDLQQRRAALKQQHDQLLANINAAAGAMQAFDEMIATETAIIAKEVDGKLADPKPAPKRERKRAR